MNDVDPYLAEAEALAAEEERIERFGKLGTRAVEAGAGGAGGVGDIACGVCSSSAGAAAAAQLELAAVDAAIATTQHSPRRATDGTDVTYDSDESLSSGENGETDNGRFSTTHHYDAQRVEEQSPQPTTDNARSPSTAISASNSPFSTGDDASGHPARARLHARLAAVRAAKMLKTPS